MCSARQTDLCVGIDFGTTFTGVAWSSPRSSSNPIYILEDGNSPVVKFPTLLAKGQQGKWGAACEKLPEKDKWRFFKIFLEQAQLEKAQENGVVGVPASTHQVLEIVKDYLHHLYDHIRQHLSFNAKQKFDFLSGVRWSDWKIEFIFSVPTTWDRGQRSTFREVVKKAGFDREDAHEISLGLSEAEAASVYAVSHTQNLEFHEDDIILSIDIGGGTTDLAFVKVLPMKPTNVELIRQVKGIQSGSVLIDKDLERLIVHRLDGSPSDERRAQEMSQSKAFQDAKVDFEGPDESRHCSIPIPPSGVYSSHRIDGVENLMVFSSFELKRLFDSQYVKIKMCTQDALNDFRDSGRKQVNHVVLSGGLGGSKYISKQLKNWIQNEGPAWIKEAKFHVCFQPQLAVVNGIILNRLNNALKTRIARVSIAVAEKRDAEELPLDTRIHWLIRKGERITTGDKFSKSFERSIASSDHKNWDVEFFLSDKDREHLPDKTGGTSSMLQKQSKVPDRHTDEKRLDGVNSATTARVSFTGEIGKQKKWTKKFRLQKKIKMQYNVELQVDAVGDYRVCISGDSVKSSSQCLVIQG